MVVSPGYGFTGQKGFFRDLVERISIFYLDHRFVAREKVWYDDSVRSPTEVDAHG